MIGEQLGLSAMLVQVSADPAYGWHATVMAAPQDVIALQQQAEEIARALREQYDLSE
jgi:hypothetical protein